VIAMGTGIGELTFIYAEAAITRKWVSLFPGLDPPQRTCAGHEMNDRVAQSRVADPVRRAGYGL
jgi:hypothetical protein